MKSMIAIFLILIASCQTTRMSKTPPSWLTGKPEVEGMICAVGMSEPTYFSDDARQTAADSARKALAYTLSVDITSVTHEVMTDDAKKGSGSTFTQQSLWATSAVLENSEIKDYWVDSEGVMSEKKNITYALGCMPRSALSK